MSNIVDKVGAKPINLTLANNTVENLRTNMTIPCKMAIATDTKQLCITDDEGDFHKIVNDTADEETYTRIQNGYVIIALHGDDGTVSITGNLEVANATGNIDLTDDSIKISNGDTSIELFGETAPENVRGTIQFNTGSGNQTNMANVEVQGLLNSTNIMFVRREAIKSSTTVDLSSGNYILDPVSHPIIYITAGSNVNKLTIWGAEDGEIITIVRAFASGPVSCMFQCGDTARQFNITEGFSAVKLLYCNETLGWVKYT